MDNRFKQLREECYEANMELQALGLVIFTFGNVSAVDRDAGVFAIKPSGVPYDQLTPGMFPVVDFDNKVIDGTMRPSSDTKTHSFLYKNWPNIGGIAHTHSTYAVAWAQAQRPIPLLGTTHADHLTEDIPCAPPMSDDLIEGDYEHMTGQQIVDHFNHRDLQYQEVPMVLLANHGPFTWGRSAREAVYNSKILEELAKYAFLTLQINPGAPRMKESLIRKHHERKHGKDAYYGQSDQTK